MKKFITTIRNIFSIEELRTRIINTIGFLIIFRLGSYVMLPGVDKSALGDLTESGGRDIFDIINVFSGGAFNNKAIFGLGIMPYISASIVLQLLTVAVPTFQRMQKEGESGRKKITQITRWLTIVICLIQSVGYITTIPRGAITPDVSYTYFTISSMIILTAGTIFVMWLGEKITEKGIGNGISMLIMIGIISRFPFALFDEFTSQGIGGLLFIVIEIVALFFITMLVVMITQAIRRIPVNYAKQVVGSKVQSTGSRRNFIPLKVNSAGVMPIIFAQALMFLPPLVANVWRDQSDLAQAIGTTFSDYTSWQYNLVFAILILLFTYFYTAITINPNQIADDLKRNNGFVPGVKPGANTAEYIDSILSKITLPGALFIAAIAVLPAFAQVAGVGGQFASFYGGTSLLIMVGVILDTLQQINSYLLMKHYEGMMKSGKLKGSSQVAVA